MFKIYLASSWRNIYYPAILQILRNKGFEVYDFRDPASCFSWSQIDPNWQQWTTDHYLSVLHDNEIVHNGFQADFRAMREAQACVLLEPCGRSAHMEAGFMKGADKDVVVFIPPEEKIEPDLMLYMANLITQDLDKVVQYLQMVKNIYESR